MIVPRRILTLIFSFAPSALGVNSRLGDSLKMLMWQLT